MKYAKKLLILCLLTTGVGCDKELYTNLSEEHVNSMISLLDANGIESSKKVSKDGYSLIVDNGKYAESNLILKEYGYPKEEYQSIGKLFKKEGIISSPLEERVRYMHALSQAVSETLTQIEGVIKARVHLVLPKNNSFNEEVSPSSASVFISHHQSVDVEKFRSDIKLLVEKGIDGLSYDRVSVFLMPTSQAGPKKNESWFTWPQFLALLALIGAIYFYKRPKLKANSKEQLTIVDASIIGESLILKQDQADMHNEEESLSEDINKGITDESDKTVTIVSKVSQAGAIKQAIPS